MNFLTINEVARRLQVTTKSVRTLIDAGQLKAFAHSATPGGPTSRRVLSHDLDGFNEAKSQGLHPAVSQVTLELVEPGDG